MAAAWPQVTAWPSDLREYTTYLSKYFREALLYIESAKGPVPTSLVKTMIAAISVVLAKFENAPDHNTVMQALTTIRNDLKVTTITVQTTAETVQEYSKGPRYRKFRDSCLPLGPTSIAE
jgi:hypothetical protein